MANEYQGILGQILGTDTISGETRTIKTNANGELQVNILTLPTGTASDITLLNGTFTSSGNGTANTSLGAYKEAVFVLNVSASSGSSPTLDVIIEWSPDGTAWYTLDTFTQKTGISSEVKRITNFGSRLRCKYTIGGGTPSFTFSLKGTFKS